MLPFGIASAVRKGTQFMKSMSSSRVLGVVTAAAAAVSLALLSTPAQARTIDPQAYQGAPSGNAASAQRGSALDTGRVQAGVTATNCASVTHLSSEADGIKAGFVDNGAASLFEFGAPGQPLKAAAYIRTTGRDPLVENYLGVMEAGDLVHVTVTIRGAATGNPTFTTAYHSPWPGWGTVRSLTASGPYLYALIGTGLHRYQVNTAFEPVKRVAVNTTGWSTLRTMSYSGTANLDGGTADGVLMTTSGGALIEYVFPQAGPSRWLKGTLAPSGWQVFKHVSAGGCDGTARNIVGITPTGVAHNYIDANRFDLSGADIRRTGQVASDWQADVYFD
jgi:hypothetical protein